MYGHLQPNLVLAEISTMLSFVSSSSGRSSTHRPLEGLKIYIIHVKETYLPDPKGLNRTVRDIVIDDLEELERKARLAGTDLGLEFITVERGMVIDL